MPRFIETSPVRLPRIDHAERRRRDALAAALAREVEGEVRFDGGSRALYATDASNYRQVPIGVVIPKTVADVEATVRLAREHGAPILPRGGGTSLCGQCCNVAVVIDFSKYLNRILEIDLGVMPAFAGKLSPEDIEAVARFVAQAAGAQ